MKVYTPEISWHNRLPTLALDIAPHNPDQTKDDKCYKVATGGNDCRVYIWTIDPETLEVKIRAGLRRHQKSVGALRFSVQHVLASGDDDGYIYLWKQRTEEMQQSSNGVASEPAEPFNAFLNDDGFEDAESWQHLRVLRGHIEDVCDLTWSSEGKYLLSGSVDNSAILWDTTKGTKLWCSDLIKGYVQGVAIDPHAEYIIALSSDRTLRAYSFSERRLIHATRRMIIKSRYKAYYCDDTVQTFCRRLEFSPDGQFLITPTSRMIEREKQQQKKKPKRQDNYDHSQERVDIGDNSGDVDLEIETKNSTESPSADARLETASSAKEKLATKTAHNSPDQKPINVLLVFKRGCFNRPHLYYETGKEVALCVRFSPIVYSLRPSEMNFWKLPYRFLFAVATSRSIIIYDTQQPTPIGYVSQVHLARLTDLSWSQDGQMLMTSSYDGYTTMIMFDKTELGEPYTEALINPVQEKEKEMQRERELMEQIAEQQRIEKEQQRLEKEQLREQQKLEKEQLREQQRLERERIREQQRLEKEKIREQQRLEKERLQQAKEPPEKVPEALTIKRFLIKRS